jgi:hypothetical protein
MNTQTKIQNTLNALFGAGPITEVSSAQLYKVGREQGLTYKQVKDNMMCDKYKSTVKRGLYNLTVLASKPTDAMCEPAAPVAQAAAAPVFNLTTPKPQPKLTSISNDDIYIPSVDHTFVQWGEYKTVKKVIESGMFFPLYISGMSGNGKTMMVEQACAKLKKEYIRVQISPETDEDDLIGGFRLINGETIFHKGPVIKAMERGCILMIDELDRGSNKIMCLQGVLEGKPVLVKKIGQIIHPAAGFNVIATANTKGRGSEDGRYSAANVIDEAFIERFVATIDQPYPAFKIERNIVAKHMEALDVADEEFVDKLVSWSAVIRKTYADEGVDELISTRRLCHIVKAYSIFRNRLEAISLCIARFENETREAFLDLYTKIDSNQITAPVEPLAAGPVAAEEVPF